MAKRNAPANAAPTSSSGRSDAGALAPGLAAAGCGEGAPAAAWARGGVAMPTPGDVTAAPDTPRGAARVSGGLGVLLVFAMAMQSVFLSALLTFARTPWYSGYATTTAPFGLDPLTDQRLAGVIMWIPAGGIYLVVALALLVTWIRATEREDVAL